MNDNIIGVKSKIYQVNPLKFFIVLSGFLLISICSFPQWCQSSKGMNGGNVSAFYTDTVSGYMYASCSGVIMSKDNGNTWKSIDSTLVFDNKRDNEHIITSLSNNYKIISAGRYVYSITTLGNYLLIGTSAGVYASSDTGKTWITRNTGLIGSYDGVDSFNHAVNSFAFKDSEIYVGTGWGVFSSADTGKNWVRKSNRVMGLYDTYYWHNERINHLVFIGDDLVAGTYDDGIYISKDKGDNWTESLLVHRYDGRGNYLVPVNNIRDLEINGTRIFAATLAGVYLSPDSGRTWLPKNRNNDLLIGGINSISIKGDTILTAAGYGESARLNMSADEGVSWSQLNIPSRVTGPWIGGSEFYNLFYSGFNTSWGYLDVYIHNNDFFMGTDFGVFKSQDAGISWQVSDRGIMKLGVTSLCKSGNKYFSGTSTNGIFVSDDNGDTWIQMNNGLEDQNVTYHEDRSSARFIRALAVKNDIVFAGTDGSGVFYSSNGGASWTPRNTGLVNWEYGNRVQSLVVSGNKIIAGTHAGVFVTNNNGSTWAPILTHATTGMASSGNSIYCTVRPFNVFGSGDQGLNWQNISGNIGQIIKYHSDILDCIALSGTTLFVGSQYQGIFRTDDNGKTWRSVNNGLKNTYAGKKILSLFSKGSVIYAGTGAGVYMSIDKGEHWTAINEGLFNLGVQYLTSLDSFMFAGTLNDGLWKRSLSDLPDIPINVHYFKLAGISVYPNPAVDEMTISFNDLSDEEYTVEILNIAGIVLLKTQVKRSLNTINLEGLNYHGFCIFKVTDSRGNIKGIQKIIRL